MKTQAIALLGLFLAVLIFSIASSVSAHQQKETRDTPSVKSLRLNLLKK